MKKSFNRLIRRVASGALAAAAVLTAAAGAFPAGRAFAAEYADSPDGYSADSLPSYREYRSIYADRSRPETAVVLTAADAVGTSPLQARQAERRAVLLPPIPLNRSKRRTERKNR